MAYKLKNRPALIMTGVSMLVIAAGFCGASIITPDTAVFALKGEIVAGMGLIILGANWIYKETAEARNTRRLLKQQKREALIEALIRDKVVVCEQTPTPIIRSAPKAKHQSNNFGTVTLTTDSDGNRIKVVLLKSGKKIPLEEYTRGEDQNNDS